MKTTIAHQAVSRIPAGFVSGPKRCYECGKKLGYAKGYIVFAERKVDTYLVRLHMHCIERFDADRPLTAAIRMGEVAA